MKKVIFIFMVLLLAVQANGSFLKHASSKVELTQSGEGKQWCPVCGMKIENFYKTSHTATLKDGTVRQYCSIRCLAVDMQKNKIDVNSIKVVDAKTEKLIFSKSAFYLVSSKIMGTMSMVSKLAFEKKVDAQEFQKLYGGKIVDFKTALAMAQESLKRDAAMTSKKKKKKVYPRGKKIFNKVCSGDKINITDYKKINQLKEDLINKAICKNLKEKDLQAVALYLWEVKRLSKLDTQENSVTITKKDKCPVCGMFVYKYPRWAAHIFYKHGDHNHRYSFDGVKDLMKFYFDPLKWGDYHFAKKENISKIVVTDYYTQKTIDGTKAYYVIGSDIYGPMGRELIPFESKNDAKTFLKDHFGEKIIQFNDINKDEVYKLDHNE